MTAHLLFRHGYKAKAHRAWFAAEDEELIEVEVAGAGNLVAVEGLRPHTTYRWRVVAEHDSHDMHGAIWTFTTGGVEQLGVLV